MITRAATSGTTGCRRRAASVAENARASAILAATWGGSGASRISAAKAAPRAAASALSTWLLSDRMTTPGP